MGGVEPNRVGGRGGASGARDVCLPQGRQRRLSLFPRDLVYLLGRHYLFSHSADADPPSARFFASKYCSSLSKTEDAAGYLRSGLHVNPSRSVRSCVARSGPETRLTWNAASFLLSLSPSWRRRARTSPNATAFSPRSSRRPCKTSTRPSSQPRPKLPAPSRV